MRGAVQYNPRIKRLIRDRLRYFDSETFFSYAGKYGKKTTIKEVVK